MSKKKTKDNELNNIKTQLQTLREEYDEMASSDFTDEIERIDLQGISEGNREFRAYVKRRTNIIKKNAERTAIKSLSADAGDDEGQAKSLNKKKLRQSPAYEAKVREILEGDQEYVALMDAEYPAQLPENLLNDFHESYIKITRKKETDGIIWNSEYLVGQAAFAIDMNKAIRNLMPEIQDRLCRAVEDFFLNIKDEGFTVFRSRGGKGTPRQRIYVKVNDDNFEAFADSFFDRSGRLRYDRIFSGELKSLDLFSFLADILLNEDQDINELREIIGPLDSYGLFTDSIVERVCGADRAVRDVRRILDSYDRARVFELLCANEHYAWIIQKRYAENERRRRLRLGLLDMIPDTYPELFPLAREIKRHFILHIGPTNSGKSHDAVERLKQAEHGIYLAPLRLLAYEKYEEFMEAGIPCTMITGEEEIDTEGSRVQSSTIEILDFTAEYDIAVIDEGQMLADPQRGSGWTMAILGIRCPEVHICLAPEGEQVIRKIIESCSDSVEIIRHERLVPLEYRKEENDIFPKHAVRGDAFIVFSRRDVHACAAELQEQGVRCSMIYGNLPYDVRRREVKRYETGETDVIVATDAIGMGLNLPIRRIVFLRTEKFDGVQKRELMASEVRQIGGRAGRYGMFDRGYVSSDMKKKMIKELLETQVPDIKEAVIGFPRSLIDVQGSLSYLLKEWSSMEPLEGFEMADMEEEIRLAEELEDYTDDKELIYKFVMIPFDVDNAVLHKLWLSLFMFARNGKLADVMSMLPTFTEQLEELENNFKACDILYHYARDFLGAGVDTEILKVKNSISAQIMDILKKEAPEHRTCRYCGRKLPFKYEFNVCEKCFKKRRYRG